MHIEFSTLKAECGHYKVRAIVVSPDGKKRTLYHHGCFPDEQTAVDTFAADLHVVLELEKDALNAAPTVADAARVFVEKVENRMVFPRNTTLH